MKAGSDYVDRLSAQLLPGTAAQHAMRDPDQSVAEAEAQMNAFIEEHYRLARASLAAGDELTACYERGQALHPVMDSTSPAHEGFQVWDPIHHPGEILHHGDLPGSRETLEALLRDPERLQRTLRLMWAADLRGLALKIRSDLI